MNANKLITHTSHATAPRAAKEVTHAPTQHARWPMIQPSSGLPATPSDPGRRPVMTETDLTAQNGSTAGAEAGAGAGRAGRGVGMKNQFVAVVS